MLRHLFKHTSYLSSLTKNTDVIIGIDLGTTNSCVALIEGQTPKVI